MVLNANDELKIRNQLYLSSKTVIEYTFHLLSQIMLQHCKCMDGAAFSSLFVLVFRVLIATERTTHTPFLNAKDELQIRNQLYPSSKTVIGYTFHFLSQIILQHYKCTDGAAFSSLFVLVFRVLKATEKSIDTSFLNAKDDSQFEMNFISLRKRLSSTHSIFSPHYSTALQVHGRSNVPIFVRFDLPRA